MRGAKAAGGSAPHLVAALDHTLGVVLGQVQVALKSNEIPALRTLLDAFDLVNKVITADAMHTQTATAAYIIDRGGHYVFTVKANQPGLYRRCKALPWTQIRATSSVDRTHGRQVRRTIKVAAAPEILNFPHALQVAQLRRTRTSHAKKSVEVVYIITSMATTWKRPRPRSPLGSKATGASRTSSTGSATSSTTKTDRPSAQPTRPASWQPCAQPPSASYAYPGPTTSPRTPDITPETPPGPRNYSSPAKTRL